MKKYLFIICVLANIITCGNAIAYTLNQTNDIFYAIRRGDKDSVIDFAKNPYNLERRGGDNRYTPLLLAALCGRWDFVDILLTYGSNTSITNRQGENLLMVSLKAAVPYEKFKEYSKLCNVNHVDKREKSILHHIANNILYSPDVLFYTLEIFPYINYQDAEGITPLLEAVLDGKYTTAKILLDLGADPTIKSKNGKYITDEILHSIERTSISDIEEQKTNKLKLKNIINYKKITKTDLQENIKISHSQEKKEDNSGNIFNNILLTFKNFVGFSSEKQDKELFAAPEENVDSSESSLSDTVMSLIRKIKFTFERLFSPKDSMEQGEELHSWTGPQLNEYPPATISKSDISESRKVHLKGKILCQQVSQDHLEYIFLASSGKRIWIRNPNESMTERMRYAHALGKPVFISANALLLQDNTVALEILNCSIIKGEDEPLSLSNRIKNEIFWDSPVFSLTDILLQASEKAVLDSLKKDPAGYSQAKQELEKWKESGFEETLKAELKLVPEDMNKELAKSYCTAKIQLGRAEKMVQNLVSVPKQRYDINNSRGKLEIIVTEDKFLLVGTIYGEGVCTFKGTASIDSIYDSWIPFNNHGHNDFYVLFTNDSVYIVYEGTPSTQGCPVYSRFFGKLERFGL